MKAKKAPTHSFKKNNSQRYIHWVGLFIIAVLGFIQLYFFDITFHGPDQIRDVQIVRELIHYGKWPLHGPPLFGERIHMPPGFYYLLAIPLLIQDNEHLIFITFGAAFIASIWNLWRTVNLTWGPKCSLIYAGLAFPIFFSIYTHSAWNPALTMTLSNILLASFIRSIRESNPHWLTIPAAFFLLIQVHPSGAPLLAGITLYTLFNREVLKSRTTILASATIFLITTFWISTSGIVSTFHAPGFFQNAGQESNRPLVDLVNFTKWKDALLIPYQLVDGIQPEVRALKSITMAHVIAMLIGVAACGLLLRHDRSTRWVALVAVVWLVVSMAFLRAGSFWHVDVLHPWLAVLGACGITKLSEKIKLSAVAHSLLGAFVGSLAISAHVILYRTLEANGSTEVQLSHVFFPKMPSLHGSAPLYTYRYLHDIHRWLFAQNVCQDQLVGLRFLVMRNITNRAFDLPPCMPFGEKSNTSKNLYFLQPAKQETSPNNPALTHQTTIAGDALYAAKYIPIEINGVPRANVFAEERSSYTTFVTPTLDKGINLSLSPTAEVTLRLALRCIKEYSFAQSNWQIRGAAFTHPIQIRRHEYLGAIYHEIEWQLRPQTNGEGSINISSASGAIECDVSAFALPINESFAYTSK